MNANHLPYVILLSNKWEVYVHLIKTEQFRSHTIHKTSGELHVQNEKKVVVYTLSVSPHQKQVLVFY